MVILVTTLGDQYFQIEERYITLKVLLQVIGCVTFEIEIRTHIKG